MPQQRTVPRHASIMSQTVARQDSGKTLQQFLSDRIGLSRRAAKAMLDGRSVWVNRQCVWIARHRLETGDTVEYPAAVAAAARAQPGSAREAGARPAPKIAVLREDENYLVADKPAGIVSCGAAGSAEDLLRAQTGCATLAAVHRLDRDTSGCLLFAKTAAARDAAVDVFKTHRVTKIYHAIAAGKPPHLPLTVDTPLDGKPAVTKIAAECLSPDASFLRIRIETGRTNQIRRHLASVRCPVLGDRTFGLKTARDRRLLAVPRLMLHASTLELADPLRPKSGIKAHSPLPYDFRRVLRLFGMGK